MDIWGVTPYLERAKALLAIGDEQSIRYACLEMRMCLETVAYTQWAQYGDKFPGILVGTWQPTIIIRTLAEFDPTSDQSVELSIGASSSSEEKPTELTPIGRTSAIEWRDFNKAYNSLGSYLHLPVFKNGKPSDKPIKLESITNIIAKLEKLTLATVIMATHECTNAQCECGALIFTSNSKFETGDIVKCSNSSCNKLWIKLINQAGEKILRPERTISFTCECKARMPIQLDKIWDPFRCTNCNAKYKVSLARSRIVEAD